MIENNEIPIPTALKELIVSNNILLQNYQKELTNKVMVANMELMDMLGLNPDDGWKIDMQKMVYVKSPSIEETSSEE